MPLRPVTFKDFALTNEAIEQAIKEMDFLANSPRPFGTFNHINVVCAICQQSMEDLSFHACGALITCTRCGDIHPMQVRGC